VQASAPCLSFALSLTSSSGTNALASSFPAF
jgi:hypothetical protein